MSSIKAVALYSGGLDSTLSIIAVMKQGIDVTAINFMNHFGCDLSDRSSCSKNPFSAAEQFGFKVKLSHLSEKFIRIVKNPKFGHGKNMNPCMDCRVLMIREAREFMEMIGASFIITGEVLGQRPMSQRRDSLDIIDRETGLRGYILRPLSAKLLKPTKVEAEGIIDRDRLYGFSGRSRKPQMALAKEFGLFDYPAPAGGCLLTEPNYSHRLRELLDNKQDPSLTDLLLLRVGRHFRVSPECKIIVGRNREENDMLLKLADSDHLLLRVLGYGSPITLVSGEANEEILMKAASICVKYSDAKHLSIADVKVLTDQEGFRLQVAPADFALIEELKIEKTPGKRLSLQR